MVELGLLVAAIAASAIFLIANRRFVSAVRERYGYKLPFERFIEHGEGPLGKPGDFGFIARLALFRQRDPVVERLRIWNWVLAVLWVVVVTAFLLSLLSPRI